MLPRVDMCGRLYSGRGKTMRLVFFSVYQDSEIANYVDEDLKRKAETNGLETPNGA